MDRELKNSNEELKVLSRELLLIGGISIFAIVFYFPVLFLSKGAAPWGSDTYGHIFRFEYLLNSIRSGIILPQVMPDWYLGIQLYRYYPPFLYYLMAFFLVILKDAVMAANVFIYFGFWLGACFWLLYRRWLGILPAFMGGVLYLLLPEVVRVAFGEGNLLRHFTSALLPLLFYLLLRSFEVYRYQRMMIGAAILLHLMVLSHPMMAAIIAALCSLMVIFAWIWKRISFGQAAVTILMMFFGVFSASWWLLPSLTGGITELSQEAVVQGLQSMGFARVTVFNMINPMTRADNPEALFVGLSLFVLPLASYFMRGGRDKKIAFVGATGLVGMLLVTPVLNSVYSAVPYSHLMWPARFLAPASFFLLFTSVWFTAFVYSRNKWIGVALFGFLVFDAAGSFSLIHMRPEKQDVGKIANVMRDLPGWRVATLDQSRLGSEPTYFFAVDGRREQVFGWAFQGARAAKVVASINEGLVNGNEAYLLDRFDLMGVDDLVVPTYFPLPNHLIDAFEVYGFERVANEEGLVYLHRDGFPRGVIDEWDVLGIGSGVQNFSYLFPGIIEGDSEFVDEYELAELSRYDMLVLSGFSWHNQRRAEEMIQFAAEQGARVVVDLTRTQADTLAGQPVFLDVWGERIIIESDDVYSLIGWEEGAALAPFTGEGDLWYTHTPQGVSNPVVTVDYFGQSAVVAGYNPYASGEVWYVGLNLPYHVIHTEDKAALDILSAILEMDPYQVSDYKFVKLENYRTSPTGIRFEYTLDEADRLLVPFADFDGTTVKIDGKDVSSSNRSSFVLFNAPAGRHEVNISVGTTSFHRLSLLLSVIPCIILVLIVRASERRLP